MGIPRHQKLCIFSSFFMPLLPNLTPHCISMSGISILSSQGDGMRTKLQLVAVLLVVCGASCIRGQQEQIPASQLVREVVYNELHDHARHGYWRYWIERHAEGETRREEQVETAEGPIKRVILNNGRPLDAR